MAQPLGLLLLPLPLLSSLGCAALMGSVTGGVAENISAAILAQDDLETVRDGAPAYLLAVDGLIEGSPDSRGLLLSGAQLYGSYATAFVDDPERARRMHERARRYGLRALCEVNAELCEAVDGPYEAFALALADVDEGQLEELYGFGSAWAGWIQANAGDWTAIAELPKVEALMERIIELDDIYDDGNPHLYLGVLQTQRPASLGGQPEQGRAHFERAIEISEGRNLMAKVMFAQSYARLLFDRPLHDRLLQQVLDADPVSPGRTLVNTVAQLRARELLDDADDYF